MLALPRGGRVGPQAQGAAAPQVRRRPRPRAPAAAGGRQPAGDDHHGAGDPRAGLVRSVPEQADRSGRSIRPMWPAGDSPSGVGSLAVVGAALATSLLLASALAHGDLAF